MMASEQKPRPKVMSLTGNSARMGDLTAKNINFQLKATPRVNRIQAALFTDKKQQITSPMFRKKLNNPAIYNEQSVKAGAMYVPDGAPSYNTGLF